MALQDHCAVVIQDDLAASEAQDRVVQGQLCVAIQAKG